jgi:signal transduction histidine kinase
MAFRQRLFWLLLFAIFCWGTATLLQGNAERQNQRYARLADETQVFVLNSIREQERSLETLVPLIKEQYLNLRQVNALAASYQSTGSQYFIFENAEPVFWSSNNVLPDPHRITATKNGSLFFTGNGWYYLNYKITGNRMVAALFLIRHQYAIQNSYLQNMFNAAMQLPESAKFFSKPIAGTWAITGTANEYLFSIGFSNSSAEYSSPKVAVFYGLSFLFLFLILTDLLVFLGRRHRLSGVLLLVIIAAARLWLNIYRIPAALFKSEVFSPHYYASGYLLNSTGDLFLTVAAIAMCILFFYYWVNYINLQSNDTPSDRSMSWSVMVTAMFLSTFLFSVFTNYLLSGLVINSQISFNVSNVFELNEYTFSGMCVFGTLLFALYLLCDCAVRFLRRTGFTIAYASILFLVSQGLFLVILLLFRENDLFRDYGVSAFLLTNVLVIFISYIRIKEKKLFSFSRFVLALFVFSIYAAQLIYNYNRIREHDKRQLLAAKLENEQDLVAEFLMDGLSARINSDTVLVNHLSNGAAGLLLSPMANENLDRRLLRLYFGGYLNRYEIRFRYFDREERPVNLAGDPSWNLDLIRRELVQHGKRVTGSPFYYLPKANGRIVYSGLITVAHASRLQGYLSIEMNARYMQDETGFPGLLLTNRPGIQQELTNYSFARYQGDRLISQAGNFNYFLTPLPYEVYYRKLSGMRFAEFDGYSHLFYRFGNDELIIISQQQQGAWSFLTLFSYIFTFFSISFLLIYLLIRIIRSGLNQSVNFKTRIQLTIILIVIATLVLTGAATVAYIIDNSKKVQQQRIREKINNILLLVENQLSGREKLEDPIGDDLVYAFSELSNTLGTDFNLYNLKGKLLYTTQSRIYDQELRAPLMSREALTRLTTNQKSLFTETEEIGILSYLAGYEHIRNNSNKTIGYLSLPYFARESELKRDVSTFLIALINIYILLFSLAILAAFLISNRITQPLRIIQESLRKIKPGQPSEEIQWRQNDEIGALISEYNRTVRKLQDSAELLAKSERESAWREMARQVAHEIKNPLTPMKLGVQHLLRAWEDNHPEKDQLLKRIGDTLIEQIDTLSNIATEFSNFAVMPKPDYTKVDLTTVLHHTVDLYNESGNVGIRLACPDEPLYVIADKDQLVRIFSNLVKNAIQAIPPGRKGMVHIAVEDEPDHYRVSVHDNGNGIPKELMDKIFTPNFTTKSGGTGLGLAMVKNMVAMMDGDIWFTTVENKGTSFFVILRKPTREQP